MIAFLKRLFRLGRRQRRRSPVILINGRYWFTEVK